MVRPDLIDFEPGGRTLRRYDHRATREVARCEEETVAVNGRPDCEVCQQPIEPGEVMVIAQEGDGVVMVDLLDTTADGRIGVFHESHWDDRIGSWQERDRGRAK